MCGRFSLTDPDPRLLQERFDAAPPADLAAVRSVPEPRSDDRSSPGILEPRFNVAPTQNVLAIGAGDGGRRQALVLRWDLFPGNGGARSRGPLINIRAETALGRPAFRRLLDRAGTRVLVPADAFYEWLAAERPRQPRVPMRFHLRDEALFAFPAIRTRPVDGPAGVAIFTTAPNPLVAPVHDRMPVILDSREEEAAWLDQSLDAEAAVALLDTLPAERMAVAPASTALNDARNEGPELWEAAPPGGADDGGTEAGPPGAQGALF